MSQTKVKESHSITNSILEKQDVFWENLISKYENAIEDLKIEESELQNYVYELKILVQATATFNLIKLLNQNANSQSINQLIQLPCFCAETVGKEEAIKVNSNAIDLSPKSIQQMQKLEDLVNYEKELIAEVNLLRIKDAALTETKQNVDNLMKLHFPNMIISTKSGVISEIPQSIRKLIQELRISIEELDYYRKKNLRTQQKLYYTIPTELLRMKKENNLIEDEIAVKKRELVDILSEHHMEVKNAIFNSNLNSVCEMKRLVRRKEKEKELLQQTINLIKNLK